MRFWNCVGNTLELARSLFWVRTMGLKFIQQLSQTAHLGSYWTMLDHFENTRREWALLWRCSSFFHVGLGPFLLWFDIIGLQSLFLLWLSQTTKLCPHVRSWTISGVSQRVPQLEW